jgi:hypothetical protein
LKMRHVEIDEDELRCLWERSCKRSDVKFIIHENTVKLEESILDIIREDKSLKQPLNITTWKTLCSHTHMAIWEKLGFHSPKTILQIVKGMKHRIEMVMKPEQGGVVAIIESKTSSVRSTKKTAPIVLNLPKIFYWSNDLFENLKYAMKKYKIQKPNSVKEWARMQSQSRKKKDKSISSQLKMLPPQKIVDKVHKKKEEIDFYLKSLYGENTKRLHWSDSLVSNFLRTIKKHKIEHPYSIPAWNAALVKLREDQSVDPGIRSMTSKQLKDKASQLKRSGKMTVVRVEAISEKLKPRPTPLSKLRSYSNSKSISRRKSSRHSKLSPAAINSTVDEVVV